MLIRYAFDMELTNALVAYLAALLYIESSHAIFHSQELDESVRLFD